MDTGTVIQPTPGPFLAVIITYFVLMGCIGYYATKKTGSLSDYFVMSGRAGALLSGLAYLPLSIV